MKRLIVCDNCGETKMCDELPKETDVCTGCGYKLEHISMIVTNKIR